jgi:hypothetical protein
VAKYIIRLYADSLVRLNKRPYYEENEVCSIAIDLPGFTVAVFDGFVTVGNIRVPKGLIVQVGLEANSMDEAVARARGIASYLLSMLCCVTLASVKEPRPIWAYDASPQVVDREYYHFSYEDAGAELSTRPLDNASLFALLERNFNVFLNDATIRDDFKQRVQCAIQSFRRGLADNDDVLTEFIIAWSSMEGLDCVYRKVLRSARTREFMDGVREVLDRSGGADAFDTLKELRDGLAHGNTSLTDAIGTAKTNLELVRRAFALMILRVLGVEETIADKVLVQPGYKGSFSPVTIFVATIHFEPGDVKRVDAHPKVEVICKGVKATPNDDKLTLEPHLDLTPQNLMEGGLTLRGIKRAVDVGASIQFGAPDIKVLPNNTSP